MVRIKKRVVVHKEPAVADPEPLVSWTLSSGQTVEVGEVLLIQYYGSERWQEATLKRITEEKGKPVFHFYIPSPGSISLLEERIKKVKKKQVRIKKTTTKNTEEK